MLTGEAVLTLARGEDGELTVETVQELFSRLYGVPQELIPADHDEVVNFTLMSQKARVQILFNTAPAMQIEQYFQLWGPGARGGGEPPEAA